MEVVIVGHEVHVVTPLVVIDAGTAGGDHEVGGLRLGGDLEQGVALGLVKVEQGVGAEALPVKQLARVHEVAVADEASLTASMVPYFFSHHFWKARSASSE